ncbi:MAG: 30S ribosomal protein S28e [Candidatus Micrarchaeota archaeon]|jgi:small subunit ribosomal protein S28e
MAETSEEQKKEFEGFLGEIVEVSKARTGIFGEVKQVMVRILEGNDKGRVIRRNMIGFVRVGDKVRIPDTTREAKPIKAR